MAYTGRAPSQAPLTSADINDGAVAPADLSTGGPSWSVSGATTLAYATTTKLATTSTGINVTGTVTADGLTVDGDISVANGSQILLKDKDGADRVAAQAATGTTGLYYGDTSGGYFSRIYGNEFQVRTGTTPAERMRIDSSGNVGIGTSSPDSGYKLDVAGNVVFGDGGGFDMNVDGTRWQFSLAGDEKMRIDSSGNLLVGTTSAGGSNGITLHSSGYIQPRTTTGIPAIYADRLNSDGSIIELRKDGSTIGSIGVNSGNNLFIESTNTDHAGLMFWSGSSGKGRITPRLQQTNADGTVDLGRDVNRFQNLYLSGGVYLGGTGSDNYLDEYEEGTWTPVASSANGDAGVSTSINSAYYTKIGNMVYVQCYIAITVSSVGTGAARIGGLPFVNDGGYTPFTSTHETFAGSTGQGWVNPSQTYIEFLNANSIHQRLISGTGTKYAMISLAYRTNS